jgi:hypothetical protein
MEPMRQEIVVDFSPVEPMNGSLEVEDGNAFDSAIGIVVGLSLGLLSWGVIVVLWLTIL